jgi:hypothetical protein
MKLLNSTDRYGLVAQALHWLTAALVMIGWTLGTLGEICRETGGSGVFESGVDCVDLHHGRHNFCSAGNETRMRHA